MVKSKHSSSGAKFDVIGPREKPLEGGQHLHPAKTTLFIRGGKTRSPCESMEQKTKPSTLSRLFEDPPNNEDLPEEKPSLFGKLFSFLKFW